MVGKLTRGVCALWIPLALFVGCSRSSDQEAAVAKQLYPVRHLDLVGLINEKGQEVVSPRFQLTGDWSEGLMPAMKDDKWGYINEEANFWIAPDFENATGFSEGLAAVVVAPSANRSADGDEIYNWGSLADRKAGFIDRSGQMVIEPQFTGVSSFSEGLAAVRESSTWGFISSSGSYAIESQFDAVKSFSEGLAAVSLNGQWGFIDTTGARVIEPQYVEVYSFSDSRAAVRRNEDGPWHFVGTDGERAFDGDFHWAGRFAIGVAPVRVGADWGYVDLQGQIVIEPEFERAEPFTEGRAAVKVRGQGWGFINERGEIVVEPKFESVAAFSGGLALVETNQATYGYVDPDGRMVWKPTN